MALPRYLALIEYDAAADAFGVAIPDALGCTAMGATLDEAEANAIACTCHQSPGCTDIILVKVRRDTALVY